MAQHKIIWGKLMTAAGRACSLTHAVTILGKNSNLVKIVEAPIACHAMFRCCQLALQ